uniref:FTH domain-containing protein n=1 Tax=Panagrellus redivivus TaxID=6233 RepID=A0A7E4VIL0_PANRE
MNSTLKPHLLVEVMGRRRRPLAPEKLCMLFLSYREFPDAFALAFRYRCEVRPQWSTLSKFWIQTPCGITFIFAEQLHIPILLRIAGRLTRRLEVYVFKQDWMEPFLEGIDENQRELSDCLEIVTYSCLFRFGIHPLPSRYSLLGEILAAP